MQRACSQSSWRAGPPVDCGGETLDGERFGDIHELQRMLVDDLQPLARGVVRHLITYATGLRPTPFDEPTVQTIVGDAAPQNFGLRSLARGRTERTRPLQMIADAFQQNLNLPQEHASNFTVAKEAM